MRIADSSSELRYPLERFVRDTCEKAMAGERFRNESARTLRIDVDGGVWLKPGAAIAYRGCIQFERLATLSGHSPRQALLREVAPLVRAIGKGRLYCAHHGAHACVVRLTGETILVSSEDLLAFEESLAFETSLVGDGVGVAAGGLAVVRLSGHGALALASHGAPLTLRVEPGEPVCTDPHATLAWSDTLTPVLKMDMSWRSVFAHGGHEPVQMRFEGSGFVMVQPYERPSRIGATAAPLKQLASRVVG